MMETMTLMVEWAPVAGFTAVTVLIGIVAALSQ